MGTLTVAGDLALDDASSLGIRLGNPGAVPGMTGANDRIHVQGDLRLGGALRVSAAPLGQGTPGKGYYRLLTYDGALDLGDFELVDPPVIPGATSFLVLTDEPNFVDLYIANDDVQHWKGGDGSWTAAGLDWLNDSGETLVAWAGKTAVFADDDDGGAGGTVTIDASMSALDLQFVRPGYHLSGAGQLTLGTGLGPAEIRVLAGNVATIDTVLAGSDELLVTGGGMLVLGADNLNSGGLRVTDGVVRIGRDANLGGAGTATARQASLLAGAAGLQYHDALAGASQDLGRDLVLTGAGLPAASATLDLDLGGDADKALRLTGAVSGAGGLSVTGTGRLVLTGSAAHTGGTVIANAGGVQVGEGGAAGALWGDVEVLTRLAYQRSDDVTHGGLISGAGVVEQRGAGVLSLSQANTYTGGTRVSSGTVAVSADANLGGGAGGVTLDGGTLRIEGAGFGSTGRALSVGAAHGALQVASAVDVTLSGALSGAGALSVSGAGGVILTGANAGYTGTLGVDAARGVQFGAGGPGGLPGGDIDVGPGAVARFDLSGAQTYGGTISGAGRIAHQGGGGVLTLSGANTYAGGTTISHGVLAVSAEANLGDLSGAVTLDGGTLRILPGTLSSSARGLHLGAGGGTLEVNGASAYTVDTVITGTGAAGLIVSGMQRVILARDNTYAGQTIVASTGGLQLGAGGAGGTLAGTIMLADASRQVIFDHGGAHTHGGLIAGAGRVRKVGAHTLTLTGANTYTGGLFIEQGGVTGTSATLGQGEIVNDGVLTLAQTAAGVFEHAITGAGQFIKSGAGALTLSGDGGAYAGTSTVQAGTLRVGDASGQGSLGGAVTVNGGATLSGRGVVGGAGLTTTIGAGATLAPDNSAGGMTIAGHLHLDEAATTRLAIGQAGAVQNLPGVSEHIVVQGDLHLAGNVILEASQTPGDGDPALGYYRLFTYGGALTRDHVKVTQAPVISPVGSYNVITDMAGFVDLYVLDDTLLHWRGGDGVWNSTSFNWYAPEGQTAIPWPGTTAIFAHDAFSTSGATVDVQDDVSVRGIQFAHEGFRLNGGGRVLLSGENGGMAELRVLPLVTAHIDTDLAGEAGLHKTHAGTLVLSGMNTYTGGTVLSGGVLQVAFDENLGGRATEQDRSLTFDGGTLRYAPGDGQAGGTLARRLVLAGPGTLDLALDAPSGADAAFPALVVSEGIVGAGDLTITGAGRLVLAGDGDHGGVTRIQNTGGVQVGDHGTRGTLGAETINDTGLVFARGNDLVHAGTISGAGVVAQEGAGTLTLAGANSYTGGTFVRAGTLSVLRDENLGAAGAPVVLDGGRLAIVGTDYSELERALEVGAAGGELTVQSPSATWTVREDELGVGVLRGAGALRLSGAGAVVLASDNAYSGTLTVANAGGLTLGEGGASGSVLGAIVLEPQTALRFDRTMDWTHAGEISGAGGVIKQGANTLSLSGENRYAGGTRIAGGLVAVTRDANLGAAQGGVALDGGGLRIEGAEMARLSRPVTVGEAGGVLDIAQAGHTVTVDSAIAGPGGLRAQGAGALVMAGDHTYAGPTVVANAGGVTLGDGGTRGSLAGDVRVDTRLNFDRSDEQEYAGAIMGAGQMVKLNGNILTLTGAGGGFTGMTRVEAGTLRVGRSGVGSLGGALEVAGGATLGGSGTLGTAGSQVTIRAGGVVAPGNSVGTLTVAGDLTLEPGSFYDVEADDQGQADRLSVAGAASLSGTVRIEAQGAQFAARTPYTILSAGRRVGVFQGATANYEYLTPELDYQGDEVMLTLVRKDAPGPNPERPFEDAATTPNGVEVAKGIESLSRDHPLYRHVETLPEGRAQTVFDALSGEAHASAQSALIGMTGQLGRHGANQMRSGLGNAGRDGRDSARSETDAGQGKDKDGIGSALSRRDLHMWAEIIGGQQDLRGSDVAAVRQRISGVFVGGDAQVNRDWRVGAAFGYTDSRIDASGRGSRADVKSYSAGITAGRAFTLKRGQLNLITGVSHAWNDLSTRRDISASGLNQLLKASYKGRSTQVFGELGWALPAAGNLRLEPFVGLSWQQVRTDGYQETGGFAALTGGSKRLSTTSTTTGLRMEKRIDAGKRQGRINAMLGWRHTFGNTQTMSRMAFEGGREFAVQGTPIARDAALVELGGQISLNKRSTLSVTYNGQLSKHAGEHAGRVNLRVKF